MSSNKIVLPVEKWVELYTRISEYILDYSSLDPIWIIDTNGNEVMTEEKQDQFLDISDSVVEIMRTILVKEGEDVDEKII